MKKARSNSAANVGGDTDKLQRVLIDAYTASQGIELVGEFYDAGVCGADSLEDRPGYARTMERITGNGVRPVVVEDAIRTDPVRIRQMLGVIAEGEKRVSWRS